jgi:hypothetical protein
MIRFWLLLLCFQHSVLTEPLHSMQYNALMRVYDELGSLTLNVRFEFIPFKFDCILRFVVRCLDRMQRDIVPAIQFVVELCW